VFGDRHLIVTLTVTEETPYLSGLLVVVTMMTLTTVIYGAILDGGGISSIGDSSLQAPITETRPTLCAKMVVAQF